MVQVGGSSQFVELRFQAHPYAQHDQRSKEWGLSEVITMNQ